MSWRLTAIKPSHMSWGGVFKIWRKVLIQRFLFYHSTPIFTPRPQYNKYSLIGLLVGQRAYTFIRVTKASAVVLLGFDCNVYGMFVFYCVRPTNWPGNSDLNMESQSQGEQRWCMSSECRLLVTSPSPWEILSVGLSVCFSSNKGLIAQAVLSAGWSSGWSKLTVILSWTLSAGVAGVSHCVWPEIALNRKTTSGLGRKQEPRECL